MKPKPFIAINVNECQTLICQPQRQNKRNHGHPNFANPKAKIRRQSCNSSLTNFKNQKIKKQAKPVIANHMAKTADLSSDNFRKNCPRMLKKIFCSDVKLYYW